MAGITQTIPTFIGGISEQPDQIKNPGQVKNVVNAIPDLTWGLYKRPGAKRVGATKLTNVQSDSNEVSPGKFFHYYRDETEGAYLGQIANDGRVRMWKCSDGTECTIHYDTAGQAYNSGDSDHTSITSYLTPSTVSGAYQYEDLQPLTINDTTFVTNRSKTVSTTGTTDGFQDDHFAFVELQRTENGRQYALNIYDSESTTNIARATRVKIASDDLAEGDSTGHCPGIGTQVFKVDSGSSKNLIFRITTLGQQGPSESQNINSDDGNQQANDFRCVYNRKVELLHGGEYWSTGNVPAVTLDSASVSYNYTVNIEKIETVATKANIKAVRPEPTPFDADTAVTVDTILGGIQAELSGTGITATVIGNGLYLTRSSAFNVEAVGLDLMNVISKEVNDVSKLPNQCKDGYVVKVVNSQQSRDDDYWLKFKGDNGRDGPGSWIECPEPGITKSFNAATMPHIIQRQSSGTFLVKQYTWADRDVGDDTTNPIPSFVDNSINKVLFFRNRLIFLSGESVCTSRAGKFGNFWADTALAVSAVDPIDITSSSTLPSPLYDGIEIGPGLAVFSTNQQFLFSTDADVLNPDTAKLRPISTYNYNKKVPPISLGTTIAFADNSGKYSRFMEVANTGREADSQIVEVSKVVPSLLTKSLNLITNSRENGIVLLGETYKDTVYGYRLFNQGDQRRLASWFKWKLNVRILYHFIIDDEYYFLDNNDFLQKISLVQQDSDASIDADSGVNYLIHLDNWTTITGGVYNASTQLTTFTHGSGGCVFNWQSLVDNDLPSGSLAINGKLVLIDVSASVNPGKYADVTVTSAGATFTVPGNWSSGTFHIGYVYDYTVEFPRLYVTKRTETGYVSDVNASLILHRVKLNFGKVGTYETTLNRIGKAAYNEIYESTNANAYNASDAPYLEQEIKTVPIYDRNENVDITLKSTHPAPATLHSMSWEGDYTNRFYSRQ